MKRVFCLIIVVFCFFIISAQTPILQEGDKADKLVKEFPSKAICVSIGASYLNETSVYFTTLNSKFYATPKVSLDATYGFSFLKWGAKREQIYTFGFKYWFQKELCETGFSPFFGLNFFGVKIPDGDVMGDIIIWDQYYFSYTFEVPAGINYTTKFGLNASLLLSYIYWPDNGLENFFNVELRLGWRFKFRKSKDAKPK